MAVVTLFGGTTVVLPRGYFPFLPLICASSTEHSTIIEGKSLTVSRKQHASNRLMYLRGCPGIRALNDPTLCQA